MATLTTPYLGLPYPDGAERVMDGDNAIGALANAVDGPFQRILEPLGVVASGPVHAQTSSTQRLPLSTYVEGLQVMFSDADDALVTSPGREGLYLATASGTCQAATAGIYAEAGIRLGVLGGGANDIGRTAVYLNAVNSARGWSLATVALSGLNWRFEVNAYCLINVWPTWQVQRFGIVQIGRRYGTVPLLALRDEAEGRLADLDPSDPELGRALDASLRP